MFILILAHWNVCGSVEHDISGHQKRICEQANIGLLLLSSLLLVLGHLMQHSDREVTREQPHEFGVCRHRGLQIELASLWIQTAGQQRGGHLSYVRTKLLPTRSRCDSYTRERMKIHNREEKIRMLLLHVDPVAHRSQVVSQMDASGGLNARVHQAPVGLALPRFTGSAGGGCMGRNRSRSGPERCGVATPTRKRGRMRGRGEQSMGGMPSWRVREARQMQGPSQGRRDAEHP
mmetsp:Transcript_33001/g.82962  ORF Transcript_33001/g.82962 Transcript_33001/m.82962 type:complete len:233 (-) Transcript_33001:29-727(-)